MYDSPKEIWELWKGAWFSANKNLGLWSVLHTNLSYWFKRHCMDNSKVLFAWFLQLDNICPHSLLLYEQGQDQHSAKHFLLYLISTSEPGQCVEVQHEGCYRSHQSSSEGTAGIGCGHLFVGGVSYTWRTQGINIKHCIVYTISSRKHLRLLQNYNLFLFSNQVFIYLTSSLSFSSWELVLSPLGHCFTVLLHLVRLH